MTDQIRTALALWGLAGATCTFVAGRENQVFRVDTDTESFALRRKRPGYRTFAELASELDWLAAMGRAGLYVPLPCPSRNGAILERCDGHYVDLLTWLDGDPIGHSREPLVLPDAPATFKALGQEMAKLHIACDRWTPPDDFVRCRWDQDGLLGDTPVWGRFWENPTLTPQTRIMLQDFRAQAARDLAGRELDQGLIHADLVRENVLVSDGALNLIDFDDGGYGYRLFDVATALLKNRHEPNYDLLKDALLNGYASIRPLNTTLLDLFLALRAATYVGWIVPRMSEEGAQERNHRFIADATQLCGAYLQQSKVT